MPSRQLESSPTTPYGGGSGLFKRHKVLPHPPQVSDDSLSDFYPTPPSSKAHPLSIDTSISSASGSQSSSPRTLKHTSRRPKLPDPPPTPPTHSRQSSAGNATAIVEPNRTREPRVRSPPHGTIPSTPPNQQSPPTPDVTPPRATWSGIMSLRPPPPLSERYPSSRADSFKTAPEFPDSSDDEMSTVRPILPSARPSETDITTAASKSGRIIGLGLGLELDDDRTPSPRILKAPSITDARNNFETFDGEWGSSQGELTEVEKEWDDNLMRNVTVRRRPNNNRVSYICEDSPIVSRDVVDDNIVSPTNATKFLREYPVRPVDTSSWDDAAGPTDTSSSPEPAHWTAMSASNLPTTPDLRRISTMSNKSGLSTRVEAFLVESAPLRVKTLRHTKKYAGLRAVSAETPIVKRVEEDCGIASNAPHRLVHAAKVGDLRHRSLGSGFTSSTSSSSKSRREVLRSGGIPVLVVPERSSSKVTTKTPSLRSTSSKRTAHKRSLSLSSAPLSSSSKHQENGYFDLPTRRVRRMSETASSGSQRTIDFPPVIPARRSSLSAPTSRNGSKSGSRTGSLTAESLKAHNLIHANAVKKALNLQNEPSGEPVIIPQSPTRHGDPHGDPRKLSSQQTPFSQISYETVGTAAEISEAMAVSLFPHQNKSILRIEHPGSNSSPTDSLPRTLLPSVNHQPNSVEATAAKTVIPETPPQPILPSPEEDSPFRNPRDPPLPPDIKFIPPTPAALDPATENDNQLGHTLEPQPVEAKLKRGFSLRRALANRRHSESIISRTFSFKRGPSTTASHATQTSRGTANPEPAYPSVSDQPSDSSKLHPFWRPARFWDDLEDDEYSDSDDYGDGIRDAYPRIDNRPQLPKRSWSGTLKRTFAILPIENDDPYYGREWTEQRVVRRTGSGNLRVVKGRGSSDMGRAPRDYVTAHGGNFFEYNERKGRAKGGDLVGGWKGLSRRLSEKRKEKRQGKLRGMIGAPTDVFDDRDYVLRSGRYDGLRMESNPYDDARGQSEFDAVHSESVV